ncbi:DcaP family trimeric outer membrane transporter [Chryseobacterium sp. NRRL B-14859]|uniref:DcaP family trimeric outer membrane transporter n=1 Tax=Chryseobacterium sp. NRRL B-14859 TaxID=1562763 RepID=UPI003397DFD8
MMKTNIRLIALLISAVISHAEVSAQISLTRTKPEGQSIWDLYIKGFIQTDVMIDFQDMKLKDGFAAQSIVIPQHNAISSNFSIKQSQIGVGIEQKNSTDRLSAYIEIDFYGPNGTTAPRFRHGYLQWNKWLLGQTWSNFSDLEIFPNMFDFVPPDGLMFTRRLQLRYSTPLAKKSILSLSLEDPNIPSITLPSDSLNWKKRNLLPTFTALYRYGTEKDYIKAGAVLSPISYDMKYTSQEDYQARTIIGWGMMVSGKIHVTPQTILSLQSSFGKGYATNNSDLNEEKYDAVPNPSRGNALETLRLLNIVGICEHWWAPRWSSVIFYSYSKVGEETFIPKEMTREFRNFGFNIAFQPYKKVRMGIETNYGKKETFENKEAHAWRIQVSTALSF